MSDVSSHIHRLNLIIQPSDLEASLYLLKVGFQALPGFPQLLYRAVTNRQLSAIFLNFSQALSETEQARSRFFVTPLPLDSPSLLVEFLKAQPLSAITQAVKYAWFFQVLAKRRLFFKYQPIFNLASGEVAAHECLARAKFDSEKQFNGYQLIEAALSTQLTCEFDELARTTCLEAIAATQSRHTFFINLLPNAILRDPKSLDQNLKQLIELGIQPQQIIFELTELEALAQNSEIPRLIKQMQECGFGIAIDDLCGVAPLDHYFMEFRPDVLKLDRRLIHGCSHHSLKQIVLKGLLDSAHEMDVLVIAEGLEDTEDIEFCRQLGVDYGQGFGLGKPELTLQQQSLDLVQLSIVIAS